MSLFRAVYNWIKRGNSTEYLWKIRNRACGGGMIGKYYSFKWSQIQNRFNAFIPLRAKFNGAPIFPHGIHGIFISQGATIGKNCVIFHQVTIGSNTLKDSKGFGAPIIGDNVFIGAGAKIIGGISIGDNARIGANCVVTSDIPSNSTVVLEQPRIIIKETMQDNTFITYGAITPASQKQ